jgi:hypothetical protein
METPEIDRMHGVKQQSQAIGDFLAWLQDTRGWRLCVEHQHDDGCYQHGDRRGFVLCDFSHGEMLTANYNIETLLAEFFRIDLAKIEVEKLALLEEIRAASKKE